eukprot:gnl/Spiro4/9332_TR4914_c0_g1_i1.p1 gnl/Spiro4/9332_TR4914_c0_g1~~gnl/Spiro4/9332_TR4914_c0_g1_i1.p1  ORF type:complete len:202 (+),score=47.86 gnl/Spiro4/9332_TR4914_c0_g1_i1:59-664(+)
MTERDEDEFQSCERKVPRRLYSYAWSQGFVSPHVRTPLPTIRHLVAQLALTRADVVFDLGCGDGCVLIEAARASGCRGVGVDLDSALIALAMNAREREGVAELVEFRCEDLTTVDTSAATVVVMYLLPAALEKMCDRLKAFVDRGVVVVSIGWPVPPLDPPFLAVHADSVVPTGDSLPAAPTGDSRPVAAIGYYIYKIQSF